MKSHVAQRHLLQGGQVSGTIFATQEGCQVRMWHIADGQPWTFERPDVKSRVDAEAFAQRQGMQLTWVDRAPTR